MSIEHETPEEIGLIEVVLVSDDDGHEYLIPKELEKKFEKWMSINEELDNHEYSEYEQLDSLFSVYRKEGHTPSLYAKVGYEKEL